MKIGAPLRVTSERMPGNDKREGGGGGGGERKREREGEGEREREGWRERDGERGREKAKQPERSIAARPFFFSEMRFGFPAVRSLAGTESPTHP